MKEDATELGTRVEIKNINSFSSVREAILSEEKRQLEILESGGVVLQETRRFDETTLETYSMRSKEDAIDYRYFTDPNLPPIKIDRKWCEEIRAEIPVLHNERYRKYTKEYGINSKDANTLVRDKYVSDFYEECIKSSNQYLIISNWLTGDVLGNLNKMGISLKESKITSKMLVDLVDLITSGKISGKQGKTVLEKMLDSGKNANTLVDELGLSQIGNPEEIRAIVLAVMDENKELILDYKNGKRVFDYFIGQVMKKSRGRANPALTSQILKEELSKVE